MKKILIFIVAILFSYALLIYSKETYSFIDTLLIPYLAIISGVIIASISTILGNINSLFALLRLKQESLSIEKKEAVMNSLLRVEDLLGKVVKEIKDNAIFIVISCMLVIILRIAVNIDIPGISFPSFGAFFSKTLLINVLCLSLALLCTVSMLDTLFCFFKINDHFKILQ